MKVRKQLSNRIQLRSKNGCNATKVFVTPTGNLIGLSGMSRAAFLFLTAWIAPELLGSVHP